MTEPSLEEIKAEQDKLAEEQKRRAKMRGEFDEEKHRQEEIERRQREREERAHEDEILAQEKLKELKRDGKSRLLHLFPEFLAEIALQVQQRLDKVPNPSFDLSLTVRNPEERRPKFEIKLYQEMNVEEEIKRNSRGSESCVV